MVLLKKENIQIMNIVKIGLLFLSVALLSFSIKKEPRNTLINATIFDQNSIEKFLYLEIKGEKGSSVEVRLNDIPACKLSIENKENSGNSFAQVKYYVKPGINTITVYPLNNRGKATVRLVNYKKGDITGGDSGEVLVKIVIEDNYEPVHKQVELSSDRIKWEWMNTDVITDDKSKSEAIDFAKHFYKMMEESNVAEMIAVADPLLSYQLVSKPNLTKDKLVAQWKENMTTMFTSENIFDDINTISIQLIPIANGKLFEVKRKDGSMLFRTSDKSEYVVGFKKVIGRKNGVWQFYH